MEKNIIDKIDSYIDNEIKLITCFTEILYYKLLFLELLNNATFIEGLESGLKKLLLGYLRDIRFYYRFLNDIKIKYPDLDIKKIQKNIFILETSNVKNYYICLNDINIISFKEIIEKNMKFDVAIMNPPYGKTLPFEITKHVLEHVNDFVCYIGPIGKIYSLIESNALTDGINEHIKVYEPIENFGELFGITQRELSGLLVLTNNIVEKKYRHIEFKDIYKKIKAKKLSSIRSICIHNKTENSIPMQGDNGYAKGWHMTPKQIHQAAKKTTAQIDFNNKIEQANYLKSLDLWLYKLIYILDDNSAVPAHMPWLNDYSEEWSNAKLCNFFEITGYIDDDHAEPGSEWELILNSIKDIHF